MSTSPEESVFDAVVDLPPERRAALLDELCAGDDNLRSSVLQLLALDLALTPTALGGRSDTVIHRASEAPPTSIGPYRIEHKLGEGGAAEVHAAVDVRLGRRVALKLLRVHGEADADRIDRFAREARAASALNHPNILTIYESGQLGSLHYIATELVDGETLRDFVRNNSLALRARVELALQIASAIAAAHDAGIVHRDIKPENVMVRRDGYVKVLDFGIAKRVPAEFTKGESIAGRSTEPGLVMGTVGYMPPEQLRGQGIDRRSDVFSLGVLLYELFAGERPFRGETWSDVIAAVLATEPDYGQLDPRVRRIVEPALRKEPADRPADASAILADLRELHESLTGTAESMPIARRTRSRLLLSIGTVVVVGLAISGWRAFTADGPIGSIAVLPFQDAQFDADEAFWVEGLTENVIQRLSRITDLRVMSLHAVSRYERAAADVRAVGTELGVAAALVGRLERRADEFVLHTELIDTRDGRRLWGERYRGVATDFGALQEQLVTAVARRLRAGLSAERLAAVTRADTNDSEAYRLYLRGRYMWNMRSADGIADAIESFDRAIERDPRFARAWAGLADCHAILPNYTSRPPADSMRAARAAATRALELDETLAEAHASLGLVKKDYEWDFDAAERELARAIALQPSYASAYHWCAENRVMLGQFDAALEAAHAARELDPRSRIIHGAIGWVHYMAGHAELAIAQLEWTRDLDPGFARTSFFLGRAYQLGGRLADAERALATAVDASGRLPLIVGSYGNVLGVRGEHERARALLRELHERAADAYVTPVAMALVHAGIGEIDAAIDALERARDERDSALVYFLRDPQIAMLTSDDRYRAIVREVGLR